MALPLHSRSCRPESHRADGPGCHPWVWVKCCFYHRTRRRDTCLHSRRVHFMLSANSHRNDHDKGWKCIVRDSTEKRQVWDSVQWDRATTGNDQGLEGCLPVRSMFSRGLTHHRTQDGVSRPHLTLRFRQSTHDSARRRRLVPIISVQYGSRL